MKVNRSEAGFGLMDIAIVVTILFVVAFFVVVPQLGGRQRGHPRIKCVSNLKNIGLAFRVFATDNNDQYPGAILTSNGVNFGAVDVVTVFRSLSNELSTPELLWSPADKKRKAAESFDKLEPKNISYYASLSANSSNVSSFLAGDRNIVIRSNLVRGLLPLTTNLQPSWSKEMHREQGDIVMGDGSVQQMSSSRLKQSLRDQEIATNYLVFPN